MLYNNYMDTLTIVFMSFGGLSLCIAGIYFYLFAKSQERFIQFWGLCWVCYSAGLFFLVYHQLYSGFDVLFDIRKILDMFNLLFILFGTYSLAENPVPGYWIRFSLYITMWTLLSAYYHFDLLSSYIPISMYQFCITAGFSYMIMTSWKIPAPEKIVCLIIFATWGFGKTVISYTETFDYYNGNLFLAEIVFYNMLNFIAFLIYLQQSKQKLGLVENRLKLIAENAQDIIFFYDMTKNQFSYITPSVEKILGYGPNHFISNQKLIYNIVNPEDYDRLDEIFKREDSGELHKTGIFKMYNKDGNMLWGEISTTLILQEGLPSALDGTIRDITTLKEAENQLISTMQSREILLSYISHELKTPITSIIGYVSGLQDNKFDTETDKAQALDIIFSKALTLEHLIMDLSMLSKLETNQFHFDFMVIDGNQLYNILIEKHRMDITTQNILFEDKSNLNNLKKVSIIADPIRLEQVFVNILSNALKFAKSGDVFTLYMDVDFKKNLLVFSITDHGPGIASEHLPHVFDRFYKVADSKYPNSKASASSSGLGLTISKEIVKAHHGTISVKSSKKRTVFTVSIPLYFENE